MARHRARHRAHNRGRHALTGPAARLLALTALTLTSAGLALSPVSADAATSRGWGGGDGNGANSRYVINNGQNNLNSLLVGSQRNATGAQQVITGVDASVNTQASNCLHRPGCRGSQNLRGRNQSSPRTSGTVINRR
ncbi:UNVERIFIED_ORG: putative iron-regulated membrane protein [Microbispora rosea subsp. rosea]